MSISMRSGERIYVNGAVLRVDRKVTLELINEVAFLLENQVMQVEDAVTPLRQLYFVVQLMLMSPHDNDPVRAVFRVQRCELIAVTDNADILQGLEEVEDLVEAKRYFDALRRLRALFEIEDSILTRPDTTWKMETA
ncbi:flagellar biosynthesis repressor FlbT [Rhodopseudomonas sp. NSM]|uniref:flagellar biosynthesis repressor FlbT n=1 Tax=Rhodopseudomonas sp. NSM TaxID=3457630 RepID=UPI00403558AC